MKSAVDSCASAIPPNPISAIVVLGFTWATPPFALFSLNTYNGVSYVYVISLVYLVKPFASSSI